MLPIALLFSVAFSFAPIVEEIESMVYRNGVPASVMIGIAQGEGYMRPNAFNPRDTDGKPKYTMFQMDLDTFRAKGGTNINDWREVTQISAEYMREG